MRRAFAAAVICSLLGAAPAMAKDPIDLMPIYVRVPLGRTHTLSLPLASCSWERWGPPIVRVVRVTSGRRTTIVLEGRTRGRGAGVVLRCDGDVRQELSIEVK